MINYQNGYALHKPSATIFEIADLDSYIAELLNCDCKTRFIFNKCACYYKIKRFLSLYEHFDCKMKAKNSDIVKLLEDRCSKKNVWRTRVTFGSKKCWRKRHFQNPKTFAELRNISAMESEDLLHLVRRKKSNVPTKRSSKRRSSYCNNNWKQNRRNQYK